jgi:molybdopterin adenylyltransferase
MTEPAGRARVAIVLTVSDSVHAGRRDDASGAAVAARLTDLGWNVRRVVVPDERSLIATAISDAAGLGCLVVTTGGTGLTPRDVTPEATADVVERVVPGLAEAMRAAGRSTTPLADLSRAMAGTIGDALVVNLPGSPRGAIESLGAIEAALPHAIETLAGPHDHDAQAAPVRAPAGR